MFGTFQTMEHCVKNAIRRDTIKTALMSQNANDAVNLLNTSKSITNRSSLNEILIVDFIKESMLHENYAE